jgi:hypothetical protein
VVASRQKDAYPTTVWRALPPPEKVVRWGSLAALGLAFFRRLPREHSCWTHFTRTTPKTCRAHFVRLPAGAFGVAKGCHPLAPSRRARHQSANTKHQYEKLIAGCGEGAKNWGRWPHFPAIEAAYLIGCTSKGGARYRNRPQDAKTDRNRIAPKRPLKRALKRCKLSGSKRPALWVGMPQNAIQAATS